MKYIISSKRYMSEENKSYLFPSLLCGSFQAVIFNPVDRALFLRVHHQISIFNKKIWINPYQGFMNVAFYRILSGSLYFYLQGETKKYLTYYSFNREKYPISYNLIVGFIAGSINGIILNQFQIIKYQMWTKNKGSFFSVFRDMYNYGGFNIFFKGSKVTIMRDSIFGLSYEILRMSHITKNYNGNIQFLCNMSAAMIASSFSSFHNYCRSRIYASPYNDIKISNIFMIMYHKTKKHKNFYNKIAFINSRLNIGLGTIRVGVGIASSQYIFNKISFSK